MSESFERARERFSPMHFIDEIASKSRADGEIPDEKTIGRECYAFSEQEDRAFDIAEAAARKVLDGLHEHDYEISRDAIGNMFIRFFGSNPNAKWVVMGSHLDSVANGGKYDGVAGVAMALGVLDSLTQKGKKPAQDFVVSIWRSEESSPKNGVALLGSSIATGQISEEELNKIVYDKASGKTLKAHLEEREPGSWERVIELAKNPSITKEKIGRYLESHIEQSAVALTKGKDVGIVEGGIGGSRRDTFETKLVPERIETPPGAFKKFTLRFLGEPAHTGGTPPNPNFFRLEGFEWYRKDALVASCHVTNMLLRHKGVQLLSSGHKQRTGFTSIPAYQIVELLVPAKEERKIKRAIQEFKMKINDKLRVDVRHETGEYISQYADVVSRKAARQILDLPQVVSALSTEALHKEGTETGATRATVTDFFLKPEGVSYNLDLREVNEEYLKRLINEIYENFDFALGPGNYKTIACKAHAPVDEGLVQRLQEYAKKLGISFVLMPSSPGHDAGNMAAAGIPTAMIFIKHDGRSHHPGETITEPDFSKAAQLAEALIHEATGVAGVA